MQNLRETKKAQTRQAIAEAAHALFQKVGYKETTLADIAHAASVAPRTIFAYFPSKESIVFCDIDEVLAELKASFANRESASVVTVIKEFAIELHDQTCMDHDMQQQRHYMIREHDDLRKYAAQIGDQLELILLEAFADELHLPASALEPKLAAAVMGSVLDHIQSTSEPLTHAEISQLIGRALTFTEAGMQSLHALKK